MGEKEADGEEDNRERAEAEEDRWMRGDILEVGEGGCTREERCNLTWPDLRLMKLTKFWRKLSDNRTFGKADSAIKLV